MARAPGLSITLSKDWNRFHQWTAAFKGKLNIAALTAIRRATQFILSEIIAGIENKGFKKLSPLTSLIRNMEGFSNIPLKRSGALVRSITTDIENSFVGHVGLLKQGKKNKNSSGDFSNIGVLLHEGGRIKITDAMRRSFARHLGRLASKSGVSLLNRRGSKKGVIRIPPRRYIKKVFEDPIVIAKVEQIYFDALKAQTGLS